jgi:hypothetical protein
MRSDVMGHAPVREPASCRGKKLRGAIESNPYTDARLIGGGEQVCFGPEIECAASAPLQVIAPSENPRLLLICGIPVHNAAPRSRVAIARGHTAVLMTQVTQYN